MKLTATEKALVRAVQVYRSVGSAGTGGRAEEPGAVGIRDGLLQLVGSYSDEAVKKVEAYLNRRAESIARLSQMLAEMRQAPRNQASVVSTAAEAAEKPQSSPTAVQQPGASLLQGADVLGEKYYIDPRLGFCPARQRASQDS